jgi:hypothetical protein
MSNTILTLTPLATEVRLTLPTSEAAQYLSRAEQTLRTRACRENGPIRPMRINGRLAWKVAVSGDKTNWPPDDTRN